MKLCIRCFIFINQKIKLCLDSHGTTKNKASRPYYPMSNNKLLLIIFALIISILYPKLSWYSYVALLVFIHQIITLFNSIGVILPVRSIFGVLMCLQMLFGPFLTYNWLNDISATFMVMKVDENVYFNYVLPAVICFLIGLNLKLSNKTPNAPGEVFDSSKIAQFINKKPKLPLIFIGVGFFSSVLSSFFSSYLAFFFVLLGGFKFIGLFLVIIGNLKIKLFSLIIILISIFSSSLSSGMFHDLLIWLIFICSVLAIKYNPSFILKSIGVLSFFVMALFIQQMKSAYRENIWGQKEVGNISSFLRVYNNQVSRKNIFSLENIAPSVIRINQGYIISNIMITVPAKIPFEWGKEMQHVFEAAILPRFLAPNKLTSGNQQLFTKYSGIQLNKTTAMGLSSVGDAYINFGVFGGCVFMFFLGFLYNKVLIYFDRFSKLYPVLILFTPLVFYYPVRPDCELHTILGHLVKSCFLIFLVFRIFKFK